METFTRFEDYQKAALVTASMGKGRAIEGFVRVCGLVGEAAELRDELRKLGDTSWDREKVAKELGDVLWYAATLSEWFGLKTHFDFATLQGMASRCDFDASYNDIILARAGRLAEVMKKHLGHDKPMSDFKGCELVMMQDVFVAIAFVANCVNLHLGEVAAINIAKLRLRHGGGGFTAAAQNAKADEKKPWDGTDGHETTATDRAQREGWEGWEPGPTAMFEAPTTPEPACTGTVVHSEYSTCPKCDR